jgi:hypothetical protein
VFVHVHCGGKSWGFGSSKQILKKKDPKRREIQRKIAGGFVDNLSKRKKRLSTKPVLFWIPQKYRFNQPIARPHKDRYFCGSRKITACK